MAPEIQTFLLAMTLVGELRAAIPMGLTFYKLNPAAVYFLSVLGNLLAVFLVLTFLGAFSRWTSSNIYPVRKPALPSTSNKRHLYWFERQLSNGVYFFNRFFHWLFSRTRENYYDKVNKYGLYLLPFFVAIPLPVTGGWTAAILAFVFGMPFKKAFPLISLGILTAGLLVSLITFAGISVEKYFGWQVLLGLLLIIGLGWLMYNLKNKKYAKN